MSIIKKYISWIIIAVLAGIIFFQRSCGSLLGTDKEIIKIDGKKYEVVKRETDTSYVPVIQTVYKSGKTIYKENTVYVSVPSDIDTGSIIKEYFASNIYKDTLKLKDSLGYVAVTDTISKNKLVGRNWSTHINKVQIDNKIYLKELPKPQLYIGGSLGAAQGSIVPIAGVNLILKTRKDQLYGVEAGINESLRGYVQGSMLWKIKLKK